MPFDRRVGGLLAVAFAVAGIGCERVLGIGTLPDRDVDAANADVVDTAPVFDAALVDTMPPCDESMLGEDPYHCGACGHSCLGGACVAGKCQPVLLSDKETFPESLGADPGVDGSLYLADYRTRNLVRIAKDGSSRTVIHVEPNANLLPLQVHVRGDLLFWLETVGDTGTGSTIFRSNRDGTNLRSRVTGGWTFGMGASSEGVYFVDVNGGTQLVGKMPIDLSSKTVLATRKPGAWNAYAMTVDDRPDGYAYYAACYPEWVGDPEVVGIHRVKKDTGADEIIVPWVCGWPMVWYDHDIYVRSAVADGTETKMTIVKMHEDGTCVGSCPQTIATLPNPASASGVSFAIDEQFVYITSIDSGKIMRVARTGGPLVELARTKRSSPITVDEKAIYWATHELPTTKTPERGDIYRLAK